MIGQRKVLIGGRRRTRRKTCIRGFERAGFLQLHNSQVGCDLRLSDSYFVRATVGHLKASKVVGEVRASLGIDKLTLPVELPTCVRCLHS